MCVCVYVCVCVCVCLCLCSEGKQIWILTLNSELTDIFLTLLMSSGLIWPIFKMFVYQKFGFLSIKLYKIRMWMVPYNALHKLNKCQKKSFCKVGEKQQKGQKAAKEINKNVKKKWQKHGRNYKKRLKEMLKVLILNFDPEKLKGAWWSRDRQHEG